MPYTRNEDLSFPTLIIDIVNKRSYFKLFLLATSNYGRNIQENIKADAADGTFNQAVVHRVLDQTNKGFLNHQYR